VTTEDGEEVTKLMNEATYSTVFPFFKLIICKEFIAQVIITNEMLK